MLMLIAATTTTTGARSGSGSSAFFLIIILALGLMWLIVIRPQRRKQRLQQSMRTDLAVGDEVLTAGGVYGKVTRIDDDEVRVEIAPKVEVRLARRAIAAQLTEHAPVAEAATPDPADPATIEAHIGPETLHIHASLQTPPALLTDANHNYAILAVNEFDINDASKFQQAEGTKGAMRMLGAGGAIPGLDSIIAAGGSPRHETTMQRKLRILPNLRDPRAISRRTILQSWPIRTDPVIRARLNQITTDGRYAPDVQQTATQILQATVPEEDLAAAGIE